MVKPASGFVYVKYRAGMYYLKVETTIKKKDLKE